MTPKRVSHSWERRFLETMERLADNCPLSNGNQKPEATERWKAAYNELFTLAYILKVRKPDNVG